VARQLIARMRYHTGRYGIAVEQWKGVAGRMTVAEHTELTPQEAGQFYARPEAFADIDAFHRAAVVLRREDPIHLVEHPEYRPFYVLTKHADVWEAENHSEVFHNSPAPVLQPRRADQMMEQTGQLLRTLIHLDGPDHRAHRDLATDWFKPRSLRQLEDRLAQLARAAVDRMEELGGECDFARDIAMPMPLQVILSILGLPEDDFPRMLKLTQELFGATDAELARGENPEEVLFVLQDFFQYFSKLTEERKANPTSDLASVIANAEINGAPIGWMEQISYYVIIATAGHDTTSSAMAGGMQALVENPEQLDRLRAEPSLYMTAADEIVRWVTPVRHFMRTLAEPYELRGRRYEEGDWFLLSYPSANRDEEAFDDPFRFDVGRSPNRHLAFGFGAHYCLGAMLAKMEIRALLKELVPRLSHAELAGPPELTSTLFVGGHKHLPIRYEVAPASE
jgi:cytochrome P450